MRVVGGDRATVIYRRAEAAFSGGFALLDLKILAATTTGETFGAALELSSASSGTVGPPSGVEMPDGAAVFAIRDLKPPNPFDPNTGGGSRIVERTGGEVGEPQLFIPRESTEIRQLELAALPGGRVAAAYMRANTVWAASRSRTGSVEAEPSRLNPIATVAATSRLAVAGDTAGGMLAAWVDNAGMVQVAIYDEAIPAANITGPAEAAPGETVSFSSGNDRWSPATTAWWTGDGDTATGPSVTHSYDSPGRYVVTATVTDTNGNASTATRTVEIRIPAPDPQPNPDPQPEPDPDPDPDGTAPKLKNVRLSPSRFAVAVSAKKIRPETKRRAARGAKLKFRLSEAATVTLSVSKGKRTLGTMVAARQSGAGKINFSGRLRKKKLKPGKYRMTLTARDAAGNLSAKTHRKFVIVSG